MTLIWHPTTQDSEAQLREPAERGGPTWGGRLQTTMHPTLICTLSHEVVSSKRGSHVPKQVRDNMQKPAFQ